MNGYIYIYACAAIYIYCFSTLFCNTVSVSMKTNMKEDNPIRNICGITLIFMTQVVATFISFAAVCATTYFVFSLASKLKSEMAQLESNINSTADLIDKLTISIFQSVLNINDEQLDEFYDSLGTDINILLFDKSELQNNTITTLSGIENELNSIEQQIADINMKIEADNFEINIQEVENLFFNLSVTARQLFTSCSAIFDMYSSSSSGYYFIRSSNNDILNVFCDMKRLCGGVTGGWTKIIELNMRNIITECPKNLTLEARTSNPLRVCIIPTENPGCSSNTIEVKKIEYSKVCGRIAAYQVGSPDAFGISNPNTNNSPRETNAISIDDNYVDGVSLTYGISPRQHIWTFAAALNEEAGSPNLKCLCINKAISSSSVPIFVGNDYFCSTAATTGDSLIFYDSKTLWDGSGCSPKNKCCDFNNPPWFYKKLSEPITDNIEMRVCRDQNRFDEDIPIEMVEIYVQ